MKKFSVILITVSDEFTDYINEIKILYLNIADYNKIQKIL